MTRDCIALVLLLCAVPALAQEAVYFRGDEITPQHIIYGSIDTVSDSTVTINLGHAHGVQRGDVFVLVRVSQGRALPLGRMEVTLTRPDRSIGKVIGHFTPAIADLALIRAENLNLWEHGISRSDRLLLETASLVEGGGDYDTRHITPRLLDEIARDDEAQRLSRQSPSPFLVEEEVEPITMRDADIAGTFRPVVIIGEEGSLRAPESTLAYGGSSSVEDPLALMMIELRAERFEMKMPENIRLGGMGDLNNSQVQQIERRLELLIQQTRTLLVGNEPAPELEPETETLEEAASPVAP